MADQVHLMGHGGKAMFVRDPGEFTRHGGFEVGGQREVLDRSAVGADEVMVVLPADRLGEFEASVIVSRDNAVYHARRFEHTKVPVDRTLRECRVRGDDLGERQGTLRRDEHVDERPALGAVAGSGGAEPSGCLGVGIVVGRWHELQHISESVSFVATAGDLGRAAGDLGSHGPECRLQAAEFGGGGRAAGRWAAAAGVGRGGVVRAVGVGRGAAIDGWGRLPTMTDLLYLRDAQLRHFDATVVEVDESARRIALDQTAFYATGGGQPHDTGVVTGPGGAAAVTDVRKEGSVVWHTLDGPLPSVGDAIEGDLDWIRRHALMRTHSALHVLCGVIWNEWKVPVTGGNMEPLSARMDFEFDPLPPGFAERVEELVNAEIDANRPIEVSFLPRGVAVGDADLIRTKVNMIPESVTEIRVVDIVGLDKQADGGTHVAATGEIGRFRVLNTESKGKGNKRLRVKIEDR